MQSDQEQPSTSSEGKDDRSSDSVPDSRANPFTRGRRPNGLQRASIRVPADDSAVQDASCSQPDLFRKPLQDSRDRGMPRFFDPSENPLPPHLAAASSSRAAPVDWTASGRLRQTFPEAEKPCLGNQRDEGPSIVQLRQTMSIFESTWGWKPSLDEAASASAAEITQTAERAEGVLQIGASGPRIPLYGR
jgi:hypothetical protein